MGWVKVKTNEWRHIPSGMTITIEQSFIKSTILVPHKRNGVKTAYTRKDIYKWLVQKDNYGTLEMFNTKSAALSFAKRWMKAHPNG